MGENMSHKRPAEGPADYWELLDNNEKVKEKGSRRPLRARVNEELPITMLISKYHPLPYRCKQNTLPIELHPH
jgi:hypothetical protein